jgi:biotin transport system substrate-specific component
MKKTKTIVTVGMMAAVLAILSIVQIPGPTGVPFTLQVFAVALCGYVLGWKLGALAVIIYVLLGTVGVPVFAGMTAGPGVLVSVAGGFIWGFILQAIGCGLFVHKKFGNKILRIVCLAVGGAVGAALCEILGAVTMCTAGGMTYGAALAYNFAAFYPLDLVKTMLALAVSLPIRAGLRKASLFD